ncbi:hypothetical protein BRADI_1g08521v3 [Brachypodium distachyon]|uniref:DUF1618 domain-containing protein n=1 Tax=Brachypodium distachyon TaxID=15368 RepID=A0A0Q3KQ09_BRADI|nr:hypothetical protein BRADI_1g08521v3 [Brachypodium distachyon]
MPRRPAGGRGGGRAANRPCTRHLYLVTEDWIDGYSIRKVDLSEDHGASESDTAEHEPRRLPPVVFRLEAPHDGPHHFAAAIGTKIMALHNTRRRDVPVFDVRTRCLTFGPPMPGGVPARPIYIPLGDNLFRLDYGRFEMLPPPPPPEQPPRWKMVSNDIGIEEWSWQSVSAPFPPYKYRRVTSHAVHPDGRTIFVSVSVDGRATGDTLTFDTATEYPWPSACYDGELGAWVGLTADPATLGHICSCQAPSTEDISRQPPAWKLSREKLFCRDPAEKHAGATLVYLGTGHKSRFCLVECVSLDDRPRHGHALALLRLTTFSLKYSKNGDLRTTGRRRVRSFKLSKEMGRDSGFLKNPVAFWL